MSRRRRKKKKKKRDSSGRSSRNPTLSSGQELESVDRDEGASDTSTPTLDRVQARPDDPEDPDEAPEGDEGSGKKRKESRREKRKRKRREKKEKRRRKKREKKDENRASDRMKKGKELTSYRGGTVEAHEDFVGLMHETDDERISVLDEILAEPHQGSKLQRFYALLTHLSGDNATLERRYREVTYRPLREDMRDAVTPDQYDYLRNTLMYGEPRLEDRIKLSLGVTTGTNCNAKEVFHLFEEVAKDDERKRIWANLGDLITDVMGDKKAARLEQQVKTLELQDDLEDRRAQGRHVPTSVDDIPLELYEQKDRELVTIATTCVGKIGLKRDKLAEVLPGWASRQKREIREHVTGQHSQFMRFLRKQKSERFMKVHQGFTKHDLEYVVRMIRDAEPVDDAFFQDDVVTEDIEPAKAREKREEQRAEAGAEHTEMRAYVDRKTHTRAFRKGASAFESLQERIEGMDDAQKDAFLRDYLAADDQQKWDDPQTPHLERLGLRNKAIGEGFNEQLKKAGLRSLGGREGGELTKMRKRFADAFRYGAAENTTVEGSTYQRLVDHSHGRVVRHKKFGKDALALLRKLRGDEFAQVRGDNGLMERLLRKSSKKYRARIEQILGITSGEQDESRGDAAGDVLNETDRGQVVRDRDEARETASDEAELQPSHWALMIGSTVKDSHHKRRTEVNSMVTRAWRAGKRRQRLTKNGPKELSGDRVLEPMTAEQFVKAVNAQLTRGAKKKLKAKKFKTARHALREGRRPDVDAQIDDAKYRNQMKRTRGADLGTDRLLTMVDDLDGRDLLEEWSNIGAFEALAQAHAEAASADPPDLEQVRETSRALGQFVLGIREDRQRQVKDLLPPGEVTKVVSKVQQRLYDAMQSDPEVQEVLHQANFVNDEIAQSQTRALGQLDEQRQRSTGAQYNTFILPDIPNPATGKNLIGAHAASAEAKDSTGVALGRIRGVNSELRQGGDRQQVAQDNAKKLKDAQDDLDRRGKAFDELRKKYNKIAKGIIKGLLKGVMLAAMATVTALTGGIGGALAVGVMAGKTLLMQAILKVAEKKLEGDAFNVTEAVWDVTFKTLISTGAGAVGEFGGPELASALGAPVHESDAVGGGTAIGPGQGAGPMSPGQAAAAGFAKSTKKGTKKLLSTTIRELRQTDDRPGNRLRAGVDLGFVILGMGSQIGKEVASNWDEQVQDDPSSSRQQKQLSGRVAQGAGKAPKVLKRVQPHVNDLVAPTEHVGGDDRDGGDLKLMVDGVLAQAEPVIDDLEQQVYDPDVDMDVMERWGNLAGARHTLQQALDEWEQAQAQKKAGEQDLEAGADSQEVLQAVFELQDLLDEEP